MTQIMHDSIVVRDHHNFSNIYDKKINIYIAHVTASLQVSNTHAILIQVMLDDFMPFVILLYFVGNINNVVCFIGYKAI